MNNLDPSTLYGIGGIVATVLSSFLFYWLGQRFSRKNLHSVERERILRAKESLLTILESYIIEKNTISIDVISDRIDALERKESIHLKDEITPVSILQDVALRLDSTQYLSLNQKKEYSALIEGMIDNIRQEHPASSETLTTIDQQLGVIKEKIKANDTDNALQLLEQVEFKYKEGSRADPDWKFQHYRFRAIGLFFWFWIYNGIVGFSPLISEDFLNRYHWAIFFVGVYVGLAFLFSPYQLFRRRSKPAGLPAK